MILKEEINRIKTMMGIIVETEVESVTHLQNDEELKKLLIQNGFVDITPKDEGNVKANNTQNAAKIRKIISPSTLSDIKWYNWYLYNETTKCSASNTKTTGTDISCKGITIPSTREYKLPEGLNVNYPVKKEWVDNVLNSRKNLDLSYNIEAFIRDLDSIRIWKDIDIKTVEKKTFDVIKKAVLSNLKTSEEEFKKLPEEEKTKPIKSIKYGDEFLNASDYLTKVKEEGKELGLI